MHLERLRTFIAASDAGSLSRAARNLRTQLSNVSRHVAALEAEVGATLLERTGRGVRLTPAGERYLERARHVVTELDAAAAEARGDRGARLAQLRLSVPLELSLRLVPEALAELSRRHPRVSFDVQSDARRVSLTEEDFDAALRLGPLRADGLIGRALGTISLILCAAPSTALRLRGTKDLASAEFAVVAGTRSHVPATLAGQRLRLEVAGTCRVTTFTEAAVLSAASHRLVVLPSYAAAPFLATGELVRVFRKLGLPRLPLSLVHPPKHRGSHVLADLETLVAERLRHYEALAAP